MTTIEAAMKSARTGSGEFAFLESGSEAEHAPLPLDFGGERNEYGGWESTETCRSPS
jgi:hypothetical protein